MFPEEEKRARKSKAKKRSCRAKSTLGRGLSFVMNRRKMIVKFRTVLWLDLYRRKAILFCLNMLEQRQSRREENRWKTLFPVALQKMITFWMKKVAMPIKTILVLFVERYTFPSAEVRPEDHLPCKEWLCVQGIDWIICIKTVFSKGFYIFIDLSLGHPLALNIEKWLLHLWTEILQVFHI